MAMDCIPCTVMPIAPWSTPVATQNKITRSCALSAVFGLSIAYSCRRLSANLQYSNSPAPLPMMDSELLRAYLVLFFWGHRRGRCQQFFLQFSLELFDRGTDQGESLSIAGC